MSVAAIVLVVSLIVFMAIGIPITFSLGMSSLLAIILSKPLSITLIVTKIFAGADSFPILAVIYFMIAGELMSHPASDTIAAPEKNPPAESPATADPPQRNPHKRIVPVKSRITGAFRPSE